MVSSHPPRKRRRSQQARLTFEPIAGASSSSPLRDLSPANVRLQSSREASRSPMKPLSIGCSKKSGQKQQTLESSLGKQRTTRQSKTKALEVSDDHDGGDDDVLKPISIGDSVKSRPSSDIRSPPRSSFLPQRKTGRATRTARSYAESSVEEDNGDVDDDGDESPLKMEIPRRWNARPREPRSDKSMSSIHNSSSSQNMPSSQAFPAAIDDDSDDMPLATPVSSFRQVRGALKRVILDEDDDDDQQDDEDKDDDDKDDNDQDVQSEDEGEDVQTPAKRRRLVRRAPVTSDDSDEGDSNGKTTPRRRSLKAKMPPVKQIPRRAPRTEKQKKMELLRRRRAGEDITLKDLESSDEDKRGALYDTDSEHEVLSAFDDEEASDDAPAVPKSKRSKKSLRKKTKSPTKTTSENGDDSDGSLGNFVIEDDENDPLGVPDDLLHQIPLEFTTASRKPLKDHFKDVIDWLVCRKIHPTFDKRDEVYVLAWQRLNDEVLGLANSKFISTVWRPDFQRALKARPYIEQSELGFGHLATEFEACQACGRSGHPATWSISFKGSPYDRDLDDLESDSEDSDGSDGGEKEERDVNGNILPPQDKQWFVGVTCNSNAGTAHNLSHWKYALKDWVDVTLEEEGWLSPAKLAERERMKPSKRRKLANEIVDNWDGRNIIKHLFADFKQNLEMARNKPTTTKRSQR